MNYLTGIIMCGVSSAILTNYLGFMPMIAITTMIVGFILLARVDEHTVA